MNPAEMGQLDEAIDMEVYQRESFWMRRELITVSYSHPTSPEKKKTNKHIIGCEKNLHVCLTILQMKNSMLNN